MNALHMLEGKASGPVIFKEVTTKQMITVSPDKSTGIFKTAVPEGKNMLVTGNGTGQTQTFLPGTSYHLECRPGFLLSYEVTKQELSNGDVIIKLTARGSGLHHFHIRTDNLMIADTSKDIRLKPGNALSFEWVGHITSADTPWVAVVVPDNGLSQRKEISGAVWEK